MIRRNVHITNPFCSIKKRGWLVRYVTVEPIQYRNLNCGNCNFPPACYSWKNFTQWFSLEIVDLATVACDFSGFIFSKISRKHFFDSRQKFVTIHSKDMAELIPQNPQCKQNRKVSFESCLLCLHHKKKTGDQTEL